MHRRRIVQITVFVLLASLAPSGLRAQEAAPLPPAFRDAVAALEAEEPKRAFELLDTLDDRGEYAGRIHFARAVALAQLDSLGRASCSWSRAVQEEPGLAALDLAAYPGGDVLAAHLGLDDSLTVPPDGVEWIEPVPKDVRVTGLYSDPVTASTETGQVRADGVVLPDGRYVLLGVEAEDPVLARFVVDRACKWTFEPATADGEPAPVRYKLDLGSARELVATLDRPLEVDTVELPERLAVVREHLFAGRWEDAREATPDERWIYNRSRRDVALYYLLRSLSHDRLGADTEAVCDRAKARYALPGAGTVRWGNLSDPEEGAENHAPLPRFSGRDGVRQVGGEVLPPRKLSAPDARYTESMRKRRVQGVVIVQAIIDRSGSVSDLTVLKSDDPEMGLPTLDAICRWTFEPATLDGEPVPVYYNLTMNFRIR